MPDEKLYQKVVDANIAVHSRLADRYQSTEPHFRPENIEKVELQLASLIQETRAAKLLDLGCGTGFMIQIAKKYVGEIVGVDVTQDMLDKVDRSGPARIELFNHDTGSFVAEPGAYQLVTAYSFLHHLYEIKATLRTAYNALAPGGKFYADLDPNFYFWESICQLPREGTYHQLLEREIEAVASKNAEMERDYAIPRETFSHAEFGKDIAGGFKEEQLVSILKETGFRSIEFRYHWFLGEAFLINDESIPRAERFKQAQIIGQALQRALPISRNMFKYVAFVATK